ncbi:hypothetical protein M9H77_17846 [Catharanthus roseus]|uniref:Uncharacterized protein n=1 Tax=Catharanthus roseus TaxID=4058 RepID=A0ACC0B5U0_CATRO|nr:hypothetical protein M9H77_17846 [Catharanthus roseus]
MNMDERFHTRGNISCGKSSQSLKQSSRLCNHNLESLPTLYGNFVPTYYPEWESESALSNKFGVGQFKRLEWSQAMGNIKRKQEMYISSQGIKKEESMKPSLLGKSLMVEELLQARIEIDESVENHVEGEMSKELFGDSMSDMSFEKEKNIEFERKDRMEEKERLNFGEPGKNQEGRVGYNYIKTCPPEMKTIKGNEKEQKRSHQQKFSNLLREEG